MSAEKKPSNWGGVRKGAGRPKTISEPVKKHVVIERSMEEKILALGYDVATFLRQAGEEKLERLAKKNG